MAKIYGLNGKISGKVGNTVFAVDGGIQVARQYNPIVNNPRTEGQVSQRNKVSFAGQLTAGIIPAAIEGLSGNKRKRRSALNSNLIRDAVTLTPTASGNVVSFAPAKLILSTGNVALPSVGYTLTVEKDGDFAIAPSVSIVPSAQGGTLPASGRVRVVFIAVPKANEALGSDIVSQVIDASFNGGDVLGVTGQMGLPNGNTAYTVTAYLIPLELVNEGMLSPKYVSAMAAEPSFVLPATMVTGSAYNYGRSLWVDTIAIN